MTEGQVLKDYIEVQKVNKTQVAKALGMSRQNLYQLFRSVTLSTETKERLEKLFST